MHPTGGDHLSLGSVPEIVMGKSLFKGFKVVEVGTRIGRVLPERFDRPTVAPIEPVVVAIELDKIDRQLATNYQLLKIGLAGRLRNTSLTHGKSNRQRADLPKVEIGGELACSGQVRQISGGVILRQPVSDKALELPNGGRGSTSHTFNYPGRTIKWKCSQQLIPVDRPIQSIEPWRERLPAGLGSWICERSQKAREKAMDLWPDCSCRIFLLRQRGGRNDDISVNGGKGCVKPSCGTDAPTLWFSKGILVTYHQSWLKDLAEFNQVVFRKGAEEKEGTAIKYPLTGISKAINQKRIMAEVGPRIAGVETKEDHDRQLEAITSLDCKVEGRIVDPTLGTLHPVEDAIGRSTGRKYPADCHSRFVLKPFNQETHSIIPDARRRNWRGGYAPPNQSQ